jgi:hypothetical protein
LLFHPSQWVDLPAVAALALLLALNSSATVRAAAAGQKEESKKPSKVGFLVLGTVFTERGFALPGAEIRVRRAGEKKVRGEARSDRRGEFGVRLPLGYEYEVSVKARGFEEQSQKVDGRSANVQDVVFRMKPAKGEKK